MPELSTGHVFMSYSRRDDAVMRRIVMFLRQQGIKVWVDNEKLIPGTPVWEVEIEKAIKSAPAIVVVLSPDSKDSVWVMREIALADQYQKRVFPVLVRGDEESSISFRLTGRQFADIRKDEEAGLNSVSISLLRYLEELDAKEQKAKKEDDHLAAQKVKEDQPVLEKVNIEQKSQEEAERLATQKRERDNRSRKAKEKREAKNKAEWEAVEKEAHEKKQYEQMERDAAEKATSERAKRQTKQKAGQKKPAGSFLPIMIVGIFVVVVFLVIKWLAPPAAPALTKTPTVTTAAMQAPVATEPPVATKALTLGIGSTMIGKDGMTMLYVPAGNFTMGGNADDALAECQKFRTDCSRDWFTSEEPPHSVSLDAFWIDQTEVTNAMYAKCVNEGACKEPTNTSSNTNSSYYGNSQFDNYPVIYVDWNMANTYCSWAGRKLPTEAQWEKAARGMDENVYPWGNTFDGTALNFCDVNCSNDWANKSFNDGYADVSPVGNYPSGQSVYGAYDMAGNVWEWVNDWYDVYPGGDASASTDFWQKYRVLRGGSWNLNFNVARSASRGGDSPNVTYDVVGFRCARSLP